MDNWIILIKMKHSYYKGETTEESFSRWCMKNKIWRKKIRVPLELDKTGINQANPQPCDFIVITPQETKWIEIKEIWDKSSFVKSRLHQQYRLTELSKIGSSSKGYVLINFIGQKKLFYLSIEEYNEISRKTFYKKSINVKDFPKRFLFTWNNLKL